MEKRKLTVLVDMDGVLENFTEAWIPAINRKFGTEVDYFALREWNIYTAFPGIPVSEIDEITFEDGFIRDLRPVPGAIEYTERIIADGHSLYVVTNTDYRVAKSKAEFVLQRYFPFIPWNNVILASRKQMIKGDVLIDDGIHNLEGGEYGKILFTAPYNRDYDASANGMVRADTWEEAYRYVSMMAEGRL